MTDAAFALGMLGAGSLAGGLRLDRERAEAALSTLGEPLGMEVGDVARGILRVASAHMVDAIHEITVERGLDPRDGALMAYGGAGGLFATLLASESEIATVIIPPHAGNFSALGLLGADITRTAARTAIMPLADGSAPRGGAGAGVAARRARRAHPAPTRTARSPRPPWTCATAGRSTR